MVKSRGILLAAACVDEADRLALVNAGDEEVVSRQEGEGGAVSPPSMISPGTRTRPALDGISPPAAPQRDMKINNR